MKGIFLTPDTGPFFPSNTDIQTKINVGRHRHSELLARHSTLQSARHSTLSIPSRHRTSQKILSRHLTLRLPFIGPYLKGLRLRCHLMKCVKKRNCMQMIWQAFGSLKKLVMHCWLVVTAPFVYLVMLCFISTGSASNNC